MVQTGMVQTGIAQDTGWMKKTVTVRFTVPTVTSGSRLGWAHPSWNVLIAVRYSYDR